MSNAGEYSARRAQRTRLAREAVLAWGRGALDSWLHFFFLSF